MRIVIGSDHAGFELKELIKKQFGKEYKIKDLGTFSNESCDYPDFGKKVALAVAKGEADRGILVCKTGIGMSMTANKFPGIRAALCYSPETAKLSREHNDANILCLGALLGERKVIEITKVWLGTRFSGEKRHIRRIKKIEKD